MASATSSTIQNGTLVFDVYDPVSKQLIWSGQATKTLNPSGNQEKDMQRLNKAMAKLLKNFPPMSKSSQAQDAGEPKNWGTRRLGRGCPVKAPR
jgi:hypothetical protein